MNVALTVCFKLISFNIVVNELDIALLMLQDNESMNI